MLDSTRILLALVAAAVVAAAIFLSLAWPRGATRPARAAVGSLVGVGAGYFLGCWRMGVVANWPPREDQDRWSFLLLPALIAVELIAISLGRFRRFLWLPRLAIAATAARILLHGTSYLVAPAGLGSGEWTRSQTWSILGCLATALAGNWIGLAALLRKAPGRSIPLTVTLACAVAAIIVMLSGYASGGQVGLAFAAALAGPICASFLLRGPFELSGLLSLGIVGVFSLLVVGTFFGTLRIEHALLVWFAPLLCWLPEVPLLRRLQPGVRGVLRVVLTAAPLTVAVILAWQQFVRDSSLTSHSTHCPIASLVACTRKETALELDW